MKKNRFAKFQNSHLWFISVLDHLLIEFLALEFCFNFVFALQILEIEMCMFLKIILIPFIWAVYLIVFLVTITIGLISTLVFLRCTINREEGKTISFPDNVHLQCKTEKKW